MTTSHCFVPACLLLGALCAPALAQCSNPWIAENAPAGLHGEGHAVHRWDRDGAGPLPESWVFAGDFTGAGAIAANRIVTYDPATITWAPLGAGVNGPVRAMATLPNGDLVVAGDFTTAGGIPTNRIAVWNGATWAPMGPGFDQPVYALTLRPNGTLVAGGAFTVPGSTARAVAEWNGSAWSAVGALSGFSGVGAFASLANGDLLATGGGLQLTPGGANQWIIRWNGASWVPFATAAAPQPFLSVNNDLLVRANGDVVVCGGQVSLMTGGGFGHVAIWNGTAWTLQNAISTSPPLRLCELTNGDLVAVGSSPWSALRWTGTTWEALGTLGAFGGIARAMCPLPAGGLLVTGDLRGGPDIGGAAQWNGATWLPVGAGGWIGDTPRVTVRPDGSIVASLTRSSMNHMCHIGVRTAGSWSLIGTARDVKALATRPNGDVVVGGSFTYVGSTAAKRVARWDGSSWHPLGAGIGTVETDYVAALAVAPNGDLIAAGRFAAPGSIARWNGSSWLPMGGFTAGAEVKALAVLPNGDVIAAGTLWSSGSGPQARIARWNGSAWLPLGSGLGGDPAVDLAVLHDGSVAACGLFTLPNGPFGPYYPSVAVWSPATGTWTGIGTGLPSLPSSLLTAANGDLVAGGYGTATLHGVSRWNGTSWSGFGTNAGATDLALAPNGDIVVGGGVNQPGGTYSMGVARLSTTCPATVASLGVACTGAGGSPTLAATSLPWLGTTFRSRATGLPPDSLALEVLGHSSVSVPLNAILPQGIAGCTLTTAPEILNLHVPVAGAVDLALPLASSIAFVGFDLFQQVVALSFSPTFDLVALTSSNSLVANKGWF